MRNRSSTLCPLRVLQTRLTDPELIPIARHFLTRNCSYDSITRRLGGVRITMDAAPEPGLRALRRPLLGGSGVRGRLATGCGRACEARCSCGALTHVPELHPHGVPMPGCRLRLRPRFEMPLDPPVPPRSVGCARRPAQLKVLPCPPAATASIKRRSSCRRGSRGARRASKRAPRADRQRRVHQNAALQRPRSPTRRRALPSAKKCPRRPRPPPFP